MLIFFTYLYAPTVLGLEIAPARSILVSTAHDEPAIRLEIFKDVFSTPAALCYLTESERRVRARRSFPIGRCSRRSSASASTCRSSSRIRACRRAGRRRRRARRTPSRSRGRRRGASPREFPSHLLARGAVFRRRHRLHGPIALYGGRIDPGKGCEELIEYFSSYVKEGGDATLALMGVEADVAARGAVHPVRRPALGSRAAAGARGGDGRRLSVAVREPVAAGARGAVGRHADSRQRAQRRARRALRAQQRRPVLRGSRRVRRVPEAAGRATTRLRAALGRNGRDYVRQNYRWDVVLGKYERMFAKIRNAR